MLTLSHRLDSIEMLPAVQLTLELKAKARTIVASIPHVASASQRGQSKELVRIFSCSLLSPCREYPQRASAIKKVEKKQGPFFALSVPVQGCGAPGM
jgi:hypothetical protein